MDVGKAAYALASMKEMYVTDTELHENPFGTKEGHLVVSEAESFWSRLSRIGKPKAINTNTKSLPFSGSPYVQITLNPSVDTLFIPKYAMVSADVDAELMIQINTGIPMISSSLYAARAFVKAGTPISVTFDGETQISAIGTMTIGGINRTQADGIVYGTIYGYEVSLNA